MKMDKKGIELFERRLEDIREVKVALDKLEQVIVRQIEGQQELGDISPILDKHNLSWLLDSLLPMMGETLRHGREVRGIVRQRLGVKPKIRIYEDIVTERGPLHVTDIGAEAQKRGVVFTGRKPIAMQIRDNIYSVKGWHNFGKNIWGLVGQQLITPLNGHKAEQRQLTQL